MMICSYRKQMNIKWETIEQKNQMRIWGYKDIGYEDMEVLKKNTFLDQIQGNLFGSDSG